MAVTSTNNNKTLIESCRYNERLILHFLRVQQKESKANLARISGLTAVAVGGLISSLEKKGLVRKVGKLQGDMGQPATLYALEPSGAYGFGVSINRGHIETLLINFVGEVVASKKHYIILPEPEEVLQLVTSDVEALKCSVAEDALVRIVGAGIAQAFHISRWQNQNNAWQRWESFDFSTELSLATDMPVTVENDGNLAALAELIYGFGHQEKEFIYLFFGPALVKSFGGGLILNAEVRQGFTGNSGDLGLIPVPPSSLVAVAKNDKEKKWTFLTNRCSLYSLVEHCKRSDCKIESRSDLEAAIEKAPQIFAAWLEDCVDALEVAVYSMQAVVDVPSIVLDCEDQDRSIIAKICAKLDRRLSLASSKSRPLPNVRVGTLGSDAAAIGAATMPLDELFSLREN